MWLLVAVLSFWGVVLAENHGTVSSLKAHRNAKWRNYSLGAHSLLFCSSNAFGSSIVLLRLTETEDYSRSSRGE